MIGAMRGAGLQVLGMVCNICTYWVVGVPLACVLAFRVGWGVWGMWVAMCGVVGVQAVVLLVLVMGQNWQGLATQASERVDALVGGGATRADETCDDAEK